MPRLRRRRTPRASTPSKRFASHKVLLILAIVELTFFVFFCQHCSPRLTEHMHRFHSLRVSGAGSYGSVTVCRERAVNNRFCALKRFKSDGGGDEGVSWDALRELAAYRLIGSHPHVLELYDLILDGGDLVAVVSGMQRTLKEHYVLREVSPARTVEHLQQIDAALVHLHRLYFVHRDLKPDNLLVHDGDVVKIGDLGHGCFFRPGFNPTADMGTLWYRAPEIAAGRPYSTASDLWSLGCIAVELLCREAPFACDDALTLRRLHARPTARILALIEAASATYPATRAYLSSAPAGRAARVARRPPTPSARVWTMEGQKELSVRMRAILVVWLIEVAHTFALSDPALERTVELVDEVLAREVVRRASFQRLGCVCLVIATKLESGGAVALKDLARVSCDTCTVEELRAEERRILSLLAMDVAWPLTHGVATTGERRLKFDLWLLSTQRGADAPRAAALLDAASIADVLDRSDRRHAASQMDSLFPVLRKRHGPCLAERCRRILCAK